MKRYVFSILIVLFALLSLTLVSMFLGKEYRWLEEFVELRYIGLRVKNYPERSNKIQLEELIAHAGGGTNALTYTNSMEALNDSYEKGFCFLEVDLEWTSDKHLVLLHDWGENMQKLFRVRPGIYSLREFKNFKMIDGLTQMTFDDLAIWLKKHPCVYIITDIKGETVPPLKLISQRYPEIKDRVIPQIYRFIEYDEVRDLGYDEVILTLYMTKNSDERVIEFLRNHSVLAVTMPIDRAKTALPARLKNMGKSVYVLTVNDNELRNKLKANGVDGFYTDFIKPKPSVCCR